MGHIEVSVVIERPVEDVFEFTDNIPNEVIWRSELIESVQTSDGRPEVGTTGRTVWRFMGRTIVSDWVITGYEPNRKVSFKSIPGSGPVPHEGAWTYEPVGNGTKFTFRADTTNEGGGSWLSRLTDPISARIIQRSLSADLTNLKRLLEA